MRLILGLLHTRSTSPHTAFGRLQTRLIHADLGPVDKVGLQIT